MRILSFLILFFMLVTNGVKGQSTRNKKNKTIDDIIESYSVLTDSPSIKEGRYVALQGKLAVASGVYSHGKRVGTWHFYNNKGKLVQHFDYNKSALMYEDGDDNMPNVRYVIDAEFTEADTVLRPVKIGGVYFGLLPFLKNITMPPDIDAEYYPSLIVVVDLLVSPGGRLADYKIRIECPRLNIAKVANMPLSAVLPDDKIFIPAALNGRAISSSIQITCRVDGRGKVLFSPPAAYN